MQNFFYFTVLNVALYLWTKELSNSLSMCTKNSLGGTDISSFLLGKRIAELENLCITQLWLYGAAQRDVLSIAHKDM